MSLKPGTGRVVAVALGVLFLAAAVATLLWPRDGDEQQWSLVVDGPGGVEKTVSLAEIRKMPSYEGKGGFFTTTGVINGPFLIKGVAITHLCELVGGLEPDMYVVVTATDGYSSLYTYEQVNGGFITYDPTTMKEVPHGDFRLLLIYEQDGKPLSHNDGRPLRMATAGTENLLTEGHYWVKWVSRIEVVEKNTR